eukprot:CAMPEP_0194363026 /NCGR_PEP_ID=MMETSP0174-20130528/10946_1 /TAXON_ID=216777 /ORGANISM="Proboscia alata, Strain PI-D3" /LENGTH=237 /DNA_ID=CAMNT_0039136331 /DNA_START=40 /DNA_END=753 /DNA_ORIENTATION=-
MKLSVVIYTSFFIYIRTVSGQEPTSSPPTSSPVTVCPWEIERGDKCGPYNSKIGVGGDCMFNAQGKFATRCRKTAQFECAKIDSVTDIKGCRKKCQIFHRQCCCPATTESPTSSPTISLQPTSDPPTESPTITCKWKNFKRSSSCASYDREVGGDCAFDARDDRLGTTCSVVARKECDKESLAKIKGCKNECRMFHQRCCCPAGGNKPWIDDKPLVDIFDKPIIAKPIRPVFDNKGD